MQATMNFSEHLGTIMQHFIVWHYLNIIMLDYF